MRLWALFVLVDMFGHPVPEPYRLPEGWMTCPSGWWVRAGRCVPWHEGQDVEIVDDEKNNPSGIDRLHR
jgi:hypothetical protein